ncbi:MAG: efflux RND transporter permease subunit [Ichthyobacteriaceae bacterium]|nr:efflux RND transporter permease subunit [Ichthyobacteriaceae bacterium]
MAEQDGNFFVSRPIVAMVIAIIMVIVGVIAMTGLPMEQYPDITPPSVRVRTFYTGASALTVEQSVATPLEQELNGVDNMLYMKSINADNGSMVIVISFEVGSDPDMNNVLTQNGVSAATSKLPVEVKRFGVIAKKAMSNVAMIVALTDTSGRYDKTFLGNYGLINIKDYLARLPGVGRVDVMGSSDYSMRIWVRPDKLSQMGISVTEISAAIRSQNVTSPGGKFGAEPAPKGNALTYTVRLPDRLSNKEEFENIVIRTNPDGSQVKVRDVARVELGTVMYSMNPSVNGKDAAIIAVYQAPGSNTVALSKTITDKMDELQTNFPEGMKYEVTLDGSAPVVAGIDEIIETLIIALLLVIFVVFIFIQNWRATLIPILAIPVSLIATFALFPVFGFSLNVLSLLGLVLAIGIVVDDAIVVVEAVEVNMAKGMNPKAATIQAMKEVTAPVIATTLVLMAVFIPVAGMPGITGKLYQQFALTIAISVFFSAINALSLTPALSALILKEHSHEEKKKVLLDKLFDWFNVKFDKFTGSYMNMSKKIGKKSPRAFIFIMIVAVSIWAVGKALPGGFVPGEDQGYFFVNIQLPDGASLQRTTKTCKDVEAILNKHPEIKFVTTAAGISLLSTTKSTNSGFMFVKMVDWDDREITAKELSAQVNKELYMGINDAQVFSFQPPPIPGLGTGAGFSIMIQDRGGNTVEYLAENANKFIAAANARPEIARAFTTFRAAVPQKYLKVNKEKALKMGVDLNELYYTVGAFLGGSYVNDFNKFGRLYKTYIQAEPEYRIDESKLSLFYINNKEGASVPLKTLIDVEDVSGPEYTNRFNLLRSVKVTGAPSPEYTSKEAMDALEEVAAEVLPANMTYSWADMSYQEKKADSGTGIFLLSLVFIFLVLAAQYESWTLPFTILLGTPFAVLGAMTALFVARFFSNSFEFNVYAQISLVMLIAMAAKNSILIIEYANELFKEKGLSLYDAAMEGAKLRFRPILMTAFAFIFGIFPLVVASGAGAEARKVMGMALLGGMGLATFLGVFITPALFILIGKTFKYEEKRAKELKEKELKEE